MYAVVQIGSRILRSACGTKRSVPPFFCACTEAAAAVVAASAAVPARNVRRLSVMGGPPCRRLARGMVAWPRAACKPSTVLCWHRPCSQERGQEGRAMQIVAGTFATRAEAERAAGQLEV